MKTETIKASVNFERGFYLLNFLIGDLYLYNDDDGLACPLTVEPEHVLSFIDAHWDYWHSYFGIPGSVIQSMRNQIVEDLPKRAVFAPEPERYEPEISFDTLGRRVAEIVIACAALAAAVGALLWGNI